MKINNVEKNMVKSASGCNEISYNYPPSSDNGEMKRLFFNDFVAQAAVANAGNLYYCKIER